MNYNDIANQRLANQQIIPGTIADPKQLAEWMGALQAQDLRMVKWAFGLRTQGTNLKTVDKAIDEGEIIRTHLLRPTWHFVSPEYIIPLLELSAPRLKSSLKHRQDFLGLTPEILDESIIIISDILKGKDLKIEDIAHELKKGGVDTDNHGIYHILLWAELSFIICSGKVSGNRQTYALLKDRVHQDGSFSKEEALGMLAKTYFTSHGPATIKDFSWWSGLPVRDIKIALENSGNELESIEVNKTVYWSGKNNIHDIPDDFACLLPAFDELIISYTDRSAVLTLADHKKAVSNNGIFRPVVIIRNQVAGLWKAVKSKEKIIIELSLFRKVKKTEKAAIEKAADDYGRFLGKMTEVKYS